MMTQNVPARRGARRRPAIMLSGVLVLAIAAGGCTASGTTVGRAAGNTAGHQASAKAAASPSHRPSQPSSVQLVVEASGDLLIHAAVFKRALLDGGGRYYNFAPMFAKIKPYIQGVDLALCHVETPMTPATPTGYPTFNINHEPTT